ncbi:hypothetical protein IAC76_02095 [Spirochaetes bacterium]|uniref:Uncharacterized protein n=1 Tax=Candidatus Scatousia excrementipullorum TaxID=2840936 RepID=A0A9D9DPH4_9BACT|nr:hypothetical protein [Candidatus Scatousia excrementipullorum]
MNLLHYTKKLYEKINKYDKMAQNPYLNKGPDNPFLRPKNFTIIWIEKNENSDFGLF